MTTTPSESTAATDAAVVRDHQPALGSTMSEMDRQDAKWGPQTHPDGTGIRGDAPRAHKAKQVTDDAARAGTLTWRQILDEEIFEAYAETDPQKLYDELTQVSGVSMQWANDVVRKAAEKGIIVNVKK